MIDKSQMKAYAGGLSGGLGVLAGASAIDYLTTILAWLLGNAPVEVAEALAYLLVVAIGFLGGKFITYWFPPNQSSSDVGNDAAYLEAKERFNELQAEVDKRLRGE